LRVACGLVAATLAAVVYAQNARAGTPTDWQAAQVSAVPASTVELYPTNVAPATAQAAPAPDVKSPEMVMNDQTAEAVASVTQNQPTNMVVTIRIDSPGDNGPISQTNVAAGSANGTNDAATTQGGASGGAGQDASTTQQAGANTTVTQDGAGNYVVSVRINSPGNDGPVTQTNAAAGSSNAQNTSATSQGVQTQAAAPRKTPKKAAPASHASKAATVAPASPTTPQAQSPVWHGSTATKTGAARPHHPMHAAKGQAAHRGRRAAIAGSSTRRAAGDSPLTRAIGRAGDLLGTVAPRAPVVGAPQRPADVSSPVLSSLLAALAVGAAFVVWSVRPAWRRHRRFGRGLLR
jgi:hypothetical protein